MDCRIVVLQINYSLVAILFSNCYNMGGYVVGHGDAYSRLLKMNTQQTATILPNEFGYEPLAWQAPAVTSKIKISPQQPTFIKGTDGNGIIVFKLPAAVSQLLLMHTLRFCCKIYMDQIGDTVDPAVGIMGLFSRIMVRSNGTVIQDIQNQDRIYAWLMGTGNVPADSEDTFSLRRTRDGKRGGRSGYRIQIDKHKDPAYFNNLIKCTKAGATVRIGPRYAAGEGSTVPSTFVIPADQGGHYTSTRLWGGLFDYPYAVPLSLLRDLEIQLHLNQASNFTLSLGQPDVVTGLYTLPASVGVFSIEDIHLSADVMVVPDNMAQSINSELTTGNQLSIPSVMWVSQFHSLNLSGSEVREETIVLNQTLSSVRAVFVVFYQLPVSKNAQSTYCQYNPGQLGNVGGVLSAQMVVSGTSLIPQEAADNRTRMLRLYREAMQQCGINEFTIGGGNDESSVFQNTANDVVFPSGSSLFVPKLNVDSFKYGEYRSDTTDDYATEVSTLGGKFALGFPLAASYAPANVLNGVRIEHNASIRLKIQNASPAAQSYQAAIFFCCQAIPRFSANGTADTLV